MQQPLYEKPNRWSNLSGWSYLFIGVIGVAFLAAAGCTGESSDSPVWGAKTFGGVSLTIRCSDPAFAKAIGPAARSWATRTGAAVTIAATRMTPGDDTDVGIIAVSEFGAWADRGELVRVPNALRASDHPFQWTGVLPIYRDQLSEWGGQAQAIPLAGDGYVLVYRADRLADEKFVGAYMSATGRKPAAPASWDEFADLAVQLARHDGKPSLPPMSGAETADFFFRVAACYDRPAATTATARPERDGSLTPQFNVANAESRLEAPGFAAASALFTRLAAGRCFSPIPPDGTAGDPIAVLDRKDSPASLAVVSLADLAKLPREKGSVPVRFGLTALPGTKMFHDAAKGMVTATVPNYIPYHSGGRLGVVRTRCANADAAFDLLAELGGPARSLEIVGTPGLGAGPFRVSHLERERLHIWYGYGLDAPRTKQLQAAMQQYVRQEVRSPALGLRGPDQEALMAAAAGELGKFASGPPAIDILKQLTKAWNDIDVKTPLDVRQRWRKMAAGMN